MDKMAIFVEGYVELLFADQLVRECANCNSVQIEWRQISGPHSRPRIRTIKTAPNQAHERFVLIFNCGNDELVKSRMVSEYPSLAKSGYSKIVCVRDVFPRPPADISSLEKSLPLYVKTNPIKVDFILSVMEVAAWFLAEHTHFQKIDPAITVQAIVHSLHFDPSIDDMQQRPHPADDLHQCYQLGGKSYVKGSAADTIAALDFATIYFTTAARFPYLTRLCEIVSDFI